MPDADIHALSNLRALLEGFGASHASRSADALAMKELRAILAQLVRCIRTRDSRGYREADTKLHETIMHMAGVPGLPEAWKAVWDEIVAFYQHRHDLRVTDWKICVTEHEYLVEMIGLGDPAAAEEAARNHVEATYARIMAAQRKRDTDAGRAVGTPLHLAVMHMASHLQNPLRLRYIAAKVAFTSSGNLARLFRQQHGVNFKTQLKKLRMEKAAALLRDTRLPVAVVSRRVGYFNGSLFARNFASYHGMLPREWRNKTHARR